MHKCLASSLIPRLLPPPVFDRLQCAKTEGEGLGEIVMCMTSYRHEGRHEGGKPGVDQPRFYRITSCNDAVFRMLQSQVFGQDITRWTSRFFVGHRPPHVYLSHARDSFSQAFFPLRFCILQAIKTGGRNAWERGYWPQASVDDVQLNAIDNT